MQAIQEGVTRGHAPITDKGTSGVGNRVREGKEGVMSVSITDSQEGEVEVIFCSRNKAK